MRKPILAIALVALFSCPTMASFAQVANTSASSQQYLQGSRESSSSAEVSNSRLYEIQPPLSKEAQQSLTSSSSSSSSGGGTGSGGGISSRPAPSVQSYSSEEPHAQVQSYVWTK